MRVEIECPHCAQAYALSDQQAPLYAGRAVACTSCARPFTIPDVHGDRGDAPTAGGAGSWGHVPRSQWIGNVPPKAPALPPAPPAGAMAMGSLISAIIGFCIPIIPALLAIVFGMIALRRARDPRVGGRGLAIAGIGLALIGIVTNGTFLVLVTLPQLRQARDVSTRERCAEHLRATGNSLLAYASENRGRFPERVEQLHSIHSFTNDDLYCPAAAARGEANAAYLYVAGLTTAAAPESVLMYESLAHHQDKGMNVLFVDGRVEFIGAVEARKASRNLQQGVNPPWTRTR